MKNKRWSSAIVFCALSLAVAGLTGCSDRQPEGKSKEQVAAFAGDPSKMPADMKARIAGPQNAEMAQKQAVQLQKNAAGQEPNATKP